MQADWDLAQKPQIISVEFTDLPCGFIFAEKDEEKGVFIEKYISTNSSARCANIPIGSRLESIGEKDVSNLSFEEVEKIISSAAVPFEIVFRFEVGQFLIITFRTFQKVRKAIWFRFTEFEHEKTNFFLTKKSGLCQ